MQMRQHLLPGVSSMHIALRAHRRWQQGCKQTVLENQRYTFPYKSIVILALTKVHNNKMIVWVGFLSIQNGTSFQNEVPFCYMITFCGAAMYCHQLL